MKKMIATQSATAALAAGTVLIVTYIERVQP